MSEREEYTTETYPSFGKKYNGEKAIISLTSWKARINTVSKTLFSLLKQCPGFHIVLVLSEEEFPKMMNELPENLKLFVDNELIEILWVYKNYKSFKKVLFTMDKYSDVPVISADDDCLYICNYAQMLYDAWKKNPNKVVSNIIGCRKCGVGNNSVTYKFTPGPTTLFPPNAFSNVGIKNKDLVFTINPNDDDFYAALYTKLNIKIISINLPNKKCFVFHDMAEPLSKANVWDIKRDYIKFYNALA